MVNYWIFVSVPFTDFNIGTISEIGKKIETSRKWLIGRKTRNRNRLMAGDKILFYQGGEEGRKFVGSAELASGLRQTGNSIYDFVKIMNFKIWDNPVEIRTLIDKLSFIKNKKYWGVYLQGGIRKISRKDYKEVLRKAGYKHSSYGNPLLNKSMDL